jgi:hypothetical protein
VRAATPAICQSVAIGDFRVRESEAVGGARPIQRLVNALFAPTGEISFINES